MELVLHPAQSTVFADPARFKVVVAGRRWGKTTLALAEVIRRANTAGLIWYVAPTYREARDIFWANLKDQIPASWLARPPHETFLEMSLMSGLTVQLKGADEPKSLRGRGLSYVILDEFATMKAQTWDEILRPALLDTGGGALFLGTPQSFNHLYDAYQRGQSPDPILDDWASWQYPTSTALEPDGHLSRARYESDRAQMDARTFRQEYEASFETVSGRAYYAFDRAAHVGPVTLSPQVPVCVSFDFNVNPSTAVIGQVEGQHVRVWREVRISHAGGEATRATATRVHDLLAEAYGLQAWPGRELRIYGDATGTAAKTTGPSDHAVLRERFPGATWAIRRQNPHVRDRIAAVNGRLETVDGARWLTVDPACRYLIADLEQVVFTDNGDLDKRSDPTLTHLSDALGYWLAYEFPAARGAVLEAIGPGALTAAPRSQTVARLRAAKSDALRAELERLRSHHA